MNVNQDEEGTAGLYHQTVIWKIIFFRKSSTHNPEILATNKTILHVIAVNLLLRRLAMGTVRILMLTLTTLKFAHGH